jgi:3-(3-hydroxy-phenyl)propionate hydroxylase
MGSRVAVVGDGPVGQTTALLLARWGVPVVVLEAATERDPVGSKAICQQRDVLDVWETVGVGARLAEEGVTWTTARTFFRDRELFAYPVADTAAHFPPFVNISQSRTEELLDERIAGQPLIEVRRGHRVTGIRQDGTGVRLACATADGEREIAARYVVLCAGARSADLRAPLGVSFEGQSFDDRFLICDIRAELPGWTEERRFYFDPAWNPGRQVLIHPCPGSQFRIDWQVPAGYDLAAEEASGALDRRIRAIIADRDYEIVWKSVYRFQSRVASRLRIGRVLLAGDTAHLMSPFGARGLNSGVADAENAAWKLAFVWHGWAGENLLESYHDERHAAALENLAITTATMDFLVPQNETQRARRLDVLERALTDPAARPEVNSGRLAEPFWYVDSPLTTPEPSRPFAGRPPRGTAPAPGPGILTPDAPIVGEPARFRELAREGVLLLCADGVDPAAARNAVAGFGGPVRVARLAEIDRDGVLGQALAVRPGELWILRPDAHVAAVLTCPPPERIRSALSRMVASETVVPQGFRDSVHRSGR